MSIFYLFIFFALRGCGADVIWGGLWIVNEALRQKFLDLKEGAIVVSLKCLMGSGRAAARERSSSPALKERNVRLFRSI